MAENQGFRSAFNGFNKEDVVHYLQYINNKHQNQVNELTAEADALRRQLESLRSQPAQDTELKAQLDAVTEERDALRAQVEQLQAAAQAPQAQVSQAQVPTDVEAAVELDTYRRAQQVERSARDRAELVYHQANGVLSEAVAKVDAATAEITAKSDEVMSQLTQLQMAVSASKQALQDAAALMNTIRPNH